MHATAYLLFNGNCAEALRFYEKALGAKIDASMPYGGSPAMEHCSAQMADKIIHAAFRVGDTSIMASDCPPEHWGGTPTGYAMCIAAQSAAEADKLFGALSDGGKVTMAMASTFFAERFGQVTDRFGVPWMIIYEKKRG